MPFSSGSAWRTTTSPDAYQPLSTADRNEQLSVEAVGSAAQVPSFGFGMTVPSSVLYHWYRKP